MIKYLFTAICFAILGGFSQRANAQGDSCNASCSFSYQTNPNGQTVFTGQSSGVTNPVYTWYVNGTASGNGSTFTDVITQDDNVCFETTGYSYTYDSLQQHTDVDTCYAIYCENYEAPHSMGCDLDAWFTYTTNPNGVTTFTGNYSGVGMPTYSWMVNGNYVGYQSTYSGTIPAGAEVCFNVSTWTFGYDSIQEWYSDTCYTSYCELIGPDSAACDLQTWYTQSTNPNGVTTFTAHHSDSNTSNMLYFFWSVDGNEVWEGTTYSANLPAGAEVCLEAVAYAYMDSMQQWLSTDTCYATYCNVVGPDSLSCDLQVWYTQSTNPNGVTTFVANHSDSNGNNNILYFFWSVNGNEVAEGETYSANLPAGTEVCVEAVAYAYYTDSTQEWLDIDSCYATYCGIVGDSSDCHLQADFTYYTDSLGYTVFNGQYSGTTDPVFFWIVNGNYMGGVQSTYTAMLPEGTEVCFEVREYNYGYDSLQQWYSDTCFATHCEITGQTASIDEREQADFTLYPNPSSTTISILLSAEAVVAKVELLDVNGRLVMVSEKLSQIDISALQQGVYYVKLVDANGNGLTKIKKFVRE